MAAVKLLVEAGADVGAANHGALRAAAFKGKNEVVRYLLSAGADVHALGGRALVNAAFRGETEVYCSITAQTCMRPTMLRFANLPQKAIRRR